ncbi:MAG TPA: 50S ribosomal protein L25 [Planctomycetaceae bacterium]|nr:50S ribosomal protein L25 [Planctomycetaceae bacterium]|tara:strand:+ start:2220 stop:2882 length:663 start_codon:yes stop_codon:yes gene_type:complete
MSTSLQLDLTDRTDEESGSRACQRLRDVGQTPGVLYGNQGDTVSVKVDTGQLKALVDRGIRVLDFAMNGSTEKAMFRELQWDTFGITVTHFDLLRIDATQRIEIEIPVELRGTAPGTNSGGTLEQPLHSIRIDCLAVEVPEKLTVRINHLEIGDSVTAGEIELDSDVNLLVEPDAIVVRVVEIREEEDAAVLEDGEFESGPIEPEVIGRSADEDESDEDE